MGYGGAPSRQNWTLLSNHGHVLVALARDSKARLRDVAGEVGITERAVQQIVKDLADDGYLIVTRVGRRNRYAINRKAALRHPMHGAYRLDQVLVALAD